MSDADEVAAVPAAARPHRLRERDWFEDLFESHLDAVHRFLLRRGAGGDAEDLCADVFTTAWRRRADLPEGYELAWLYRAAGYLLANFRRKGRAEPVSSCPTTASTPRTPRRSQWQMLPCRRCSAGSVPRTVTCCCCTRGRASTAKGWVMLSASPGAELLRLCPGPGPGSGRRGPSRSDEHALACSGVASTGRRSQDGDVGGLQHSPARPHRPSETTH